MRGPSRRAQMNAWPFTMLLNPCWTLAEPCSGVDPAGSDDARSSMFLGTFRQGGARKHQLAEPVDAEPTTAEPVAVA
ncbi:uncharacterized protein SOCE836_027220 [Sorangium cellulosum]|uniref:Uncharacterized protein n=1 Tax=Sorangium cellulosum TaxID=56 RepID=A0A4P2QM72_SORCE|nr:uncharacterized protein SOCE836_027220 [Sorangium cellulosum]WCQ90004.1 hypothetical protein NQZ70_02703 [Sorangium sp. Soce836]